MSRLLKVSPRLPVVELRRTVEFYAGVLGFEVGLLWPEKAPSFAILHRDGVSLQFHQVDNLQAGHAVDVILSFDASDVRSIHANLEGRVPVEWGPEVYWYGRREFAVRDPSGYLVIFSEETADPPTCHEEE
jgi:catechol 2,3-dioxygenase-like lactoylglutathione lyase family enzyme